MSTYVPSTQQPWKKLLQQPFDLNDLTITRNLRKMLLHCARVQMKHFRSRTEHEHFECTRLAILRALFVAHLVPAKRPGLLLQALRSGT